MRGSRDGHLPYPDIIKPGIIHFIITAPVQDELVVMGIIQIRGDGGDRNFLPFFAFGPELHHTCKLTDETEFIGVCFGIISPVFGMNLLNDPCQGFSLVNQDSFGSAYLFYGSPVTVIVSGPVPTRLRSSQINILMRNIAEGYISR